MTTITAAVSRGTTNPFSIETLQVADPAPDEVLVRIVATGLCHSDVAVLDAPMVPWPAVLGHEGAGIVEQIGSAVTDIALGDHVATSFAWCGHCAACLEGQPSRCAKMMPLNFGGVREDGSAMLTAQDGTVVHGRFMGQSSFATHALVKTTSAIKVPDDLDLTVVAALGCGIQTGAGAALNTLNVRPGDSIIVSGGGPVGLGAVMAAHAAGATRIIAVDILDSRRELALRVGATHVVDGTADDLAAQLQQAASGLADAAFDASGVPAVVLADVATVKPGGHVALAAGGFAAASESPASTGKTVSNVLVGDQVPRTFIPRLIDLQRHGKIDVRPLITTYALADISTAIDDTRAGRATKAVLTP